MFAKGPRACLIIRTAVRCRRKCRPAVPNGPEGGCGDEHGQRNREDGQRESPEVGRMDDDDQRVGGQRVARKRRASRRDQGEPDLALLRLDMDSQRDR